MTDKNEKRIQVVTKILIIIFSFLVILFELFQIEQDSMTNMDYGFVILLLLSVVSMSLSRDVLEPKIKRRLMRYGIRLFNGAIFFFIAFLLKYYTVFESEYTAFVVEKHTWLFYLLRFASFFFFIYAIMTFITTFPNLLITMRRLVNDKNIT